MPTALTFNVDTANNRLLNADQTTALRQLRLVNGETYTVTLNFVGTVPEIDELAFYVRTQVGTSNLVSVTSFSGNSTAGYTFSLPLTAVTLLTALGNEDSVILKGYFSWTEGVEIEIIEGIKIVLAAASESEGTTASYVSSVNSISGAALITGAGNVTVSNAGQVVTISGANQDLDLSSYALTSSLNATGNALNASISALQGQTGDYYPRTNPSGYQTAANVSSSLSAYYPLSNPSGYLNSNSGVVMTTGNQTISGNKRFVGLLTGTLGSISLTSAKTYDSSYKQSVDWNNRNLLDTNHINSLDWLYRELRASDNTVSVDWENRILKSSDGFDRVDWEQAALTDGFGVSSISWGTRIMSDAGGYQTLRWGDRELYDTNDYATLDWENRTFGGSWDFADSATSSNLGTDWSVIGDTELVTKGAVGSVIKARRMYNVAEMVLYNTSSPTLSALGTTFQGAYCAKGSNTRFQIPLDPGVFAGKSVKIKMLVVGDTGSTQTLTMAMGIDWKTTALDGNTDSLAGPGWGAGSGSVETANPAGPATAQRPLLITSSTTWDISSSATYINLWFTRSNVDNYAGHIIILYTLVEEQ